MNKGEVWGRLLDCAIERPKTSSLRAGMDTGPENTSAQRERLGEASTAQKSRWERWALIRDHWEVKERTW